MANRFLCGFDEYDITGFGYEWTQIDNPTKVEIVTALNGNALKLTGYATQATSGHAWKTVVPTGTATITVGLRIKLGGTSSGYTFLAIGYGDYVHIGVSYTADGKISVWRGAGTNTWTTGNMTLLGTGSAVLGVNTEHYLEIKTLISATVGTVEVRLDGSGTPDINLTGQNTLSTGGSALVSFIGLGCNVNGAVNYFDDVYVNDATGGVNDGFMGEIRVDYHMPNANGAHSEWDRSTGADQYATIDEVPQSVSDYNSTSVADELDTVAVENFKNTGGTILAVQVNVLGSKTGDGGAGTAPVVRIDGTDTVGTTNYQSAGWAYLRQNYDKQPDTTDWNETDFNAMEVGYKKTV